MKWNSFQISPWLTCIITPPDNILQKRVLWSYKSTFSNRHFYGFGLFSEEDCSYENNKKKKRGRSYTVVLSLFIPIMSMTFQLGQRAKSENKNITFSAESSEILWKQRKERKSCWKVQVKTEFLENEVMIIFCKWEFSVREEIEENPIWSRDKKIEEDRDGSFWNSSSSSLQRDSRRSD